MLRNHGPDDAYNDMYPLKIQNSIFFYHLPQAKQLYNIFKHLWGLYLEWIVDFYFLYVVHELLKLSEICLDYL